MNSLVAPSFGTPEQTDALRGAAALYVAVIHMVQVFFSPFTGPIPLMAAIGAWSVALFFVLSGFVIAKSIRSRQRRGSLSITVFIKDRILRIFPPLVLAVMITVAVVCAINTLGLYGSQGYRLPGDIGAVRDSLSLYAGQIFASLTLLYTIVDRLSFIGANGPLWSLPYEFWQYCVSGLVVIGLIKRNSLAVGFGVAFAAYLLFASPAQQPAYWSVGAIWWMGFALGWWSDRARQVKARWWLVLLVVTLTGMIIVGGDDVLAAASSPYETGAGQVVLVAGGLVIIAVFVLYFRVAHKPVLLSRVGRYSYTLYLVHFPLFLLSLSLFRPHLLQFGSAGLILLGALSLVLVTWVASWIGPLIEDRRVLLALVNKLKISRSREPRTSLK